MDIVTHGMMGVVAASPFMAERPVASALFMLGSVLPDLDAFSRLFGKRRFLQAHQTYSHSLPVIGVIALVAGLSGIDGFVGGIALALGMGFHSLLDVTNTYGIRLFAPFSSRRYCAEWVFFIDAGVIAATIPTCAWVVWTLLTRGDPGWKLQAAWGAAMILYWTLKAALRHRARRLSPAGTLALLPSALHPFVYYGCARDEGRVRLFRIHAWTGALLDDRRVDILDEAWLDRISDLPEVRVMRELSPAYHVVSAVRSEAGTELVCKDLRTRNFNTRFGELHLLLDPAGKTLRTVFHV